MKKVCFILSTFQAGGLENYVLRFLKYSVEKYDLTILCASNQEAHLLNDYRDLGVNIVFKRLGYYNPILFIQFFRFLCVNKFEVICSFSGNLSGPSLLVSNIAKIPIRIAFYRRSSNGFKSNKIRLLYDYLCNRLVYYNASHILSNSKYAFNVFFPFEYQKDSRFSVIKNGVDASIFRSNKDNTIERKRLGMPLGGFVIGHVGRFDISKNHTTIFQVANIILQRFDDVFFVFCGKDTDEEDFKKSISKINCSDRIFLLGVQKDVPEVLRLIDLFYFPSITEGQPNALIEAMLTGIPVLTSNIEPIKEIIPEYAHNTLIDPLNINLAVKVISMLKDDYLLRSKYIHQEWAKTQFDLKTNFDLFKEIIDG